jgi:hypothetical protein
MSHRNTERAYEHETEIVEFWTGAGFSAERAYASDGESLTDSHGNSLTEDVDVIVYHGLPTGEDLLVQAKRRKSLGSYLVPDGIRDGVRLETSGGDPNLYVFPEHVFLALIEQEPLVGLHIDVEDRTRASVANYAYPPDGADVNAIRPEHQTDSYYVLEERLYHKLETFLKPPESGSNGSVPEGLGEEFEALSNRMQTIASKLK